MFFYLGKNCPINSIEKRAEDIFLDKGWNHCKVDNINYWYKGYSTDCSLEHSIEQIVNKEYRPRGKWAVISDGKEIYHPILRGFPLYKQNDVLTNIPLDNFSYQGYETYEIPLSTKKISIEEASHKINEILKENILNFFHYNKISRLRVLFSAGIDTLTVWSLIENLNIEYDLYINTPKGKDFFGTKQEYESDLVSLCKNKFWGYQMTSCFLEPNYYATGFYSERMQVREVSQGHIISNYKKQKLWELPNSKDYLYWFLQRPSNQINNEPTFETEEETLNSCNQSIFYDHQMWHIDNNFHISPFFDSRITEIINQLSLDDIIKNALDASIQKNIIKYNKSEFLQILSDYKNSQNIWTNYHKNFNKILLKSSINKFIT